MKRMLLAALATLAFAGAQAVAAADMNKTLHVAVESAETGFDPQGISDLYSGFICRVIFDPLYRYDYLARPFKIIPNTAAAMPQISDDGKTWIIKVKPGIYFADDPAFKGIKRELTAADYVYSWKRLLDPKVRAPNINVVTDRFVGDVQLGKAVAAGANVYDLELEGMRVLDRYTIQLKLKQPDYGLLDDMTSLEMSAVAREVIEKYGDEAHRAMANPIGTGPYVLKEWRRGQRITLEASPTFREEYFPTSDDPADKEIVAAMKGKRLPAIGRIEMNIIEETNSRMLAFIKGELDVSNPVPPDLIYNVLDARNKLKPELAKRGIRHIQGIQPSIAFEYFNMEDPIVGGYTRDKIALRRAISMAYNVDAEIAVVRQGQAIPATQMVPPPSIGYDPTFVDRSKYDLAAAKALLDKFGYVDRDGDGWRDLPDGKPFTLVVASQTSAVYRQFDELWKKSLTALGIRVDFLKQIPGPAQAGACRAASDVGARQYCPDAGRLQFFQFALRAPRRSGEFAAFQSAAIQRAVCQGQAHAERPGARQGDPSALRTRQHLRAVEAHGVPLRQRPGSAVDGRLQIHAVQLEPMALLGPRSRNARFHAQAAIGAAARRGVHATAACRNRAKSLRRHCHATMLPSTIKSTSTLTRGMLP